MRPIWRKLASFLVLASFLAAILAAGQTYFTCRMTGEVQADCCCTAKQSNERPTISGAEMNCCQARTHVAPGTGVQPVAPPILAASLDVPRGEPLALVPRTSVRTDYVLPDWTGPPLDQRRALISVFLL